MDTAKKPPRLPLMLAVLALSVTGCSTCSPPAKPPPPVIVKPAAIPAPPLDLMIPPPSGTFSDRAALHFQKWRQMLMQSPRD